jgi:hypothetical protein
MTIMPVACHHSSPFLIAYVTVTRAVNISSIPIHELFDLCLGPRMVCMPCSCLLDTAGMKTRGTCIAPIYLALFYGI